MLEHENVTGVVESLKIITAESTARLVHYAFQYAEANNRKKVSLIHKAVISFASFQKSIFDDFCIIFLFFYRTL